jgi:DNA-nicking Smr family endonuclease
VARKPFQTSDHALWDDVTRSIRPLQRLKKLQPVVTEADAILRAVMALPRVEFPEPRHRVSDRPPPLAQLDRRTAQRLGRGQIEPEARIDLHGEGVEMARVKLLQFLSSQRQSGNRFVLVITGKGASPFARHTLHGVNHFHAPEREGRLRREVPQWLHEDVFREHAVGFQPAHPRHGGGGAFYVRLRKQ